MEKSVTIAEITSQVRAKMVKLNYSNRSFENYDNTWEQFTKYAGKHNTTIFTSGLADDFLQHKFNFPKGYTGVGKTPIRVTQGIRAIRVLKDYNEYGLLSPKLLRTPDECPEPYTEIYKKYLAHCTVPGRCVHNVAEYMRIAKQFFDFLAENNSPNVKEIDMKLAEKFIAGIQGFTKYTMKAKYRTLKAFLQYLNTEYGTEDFSHLVPRVRVYTKGHIPTALPKETVEKLLSSIDRGNPLGKRDYAIVILAADLGLRSSDISSLTFDNFDWERKRIRLIQNKTQNSLELPLPKRVSNAVVEYLKYGRPKSKTPYIFVRHIAPYDRLVELHSVMERVLRASGVKLEPEVSRGLHILRHSLATNLISGGVPMSTVTEILGQRNVITTEIYIHSDIENLRRCALNPEVF